MALFLSMYFFSLLASLIHLYLINSKERTTGKIIEVFLLYQIVFSIGVTSLLAFIGLTVMPDYIADYVGWPACPFQQELGNVNLAFGVLGIMAIWFRDHFWLATILGFSIWILGDAVHHIFEMVWHHNYSPGNVGIPLVTDIAIPVIALILLRLHIKYNKVFS